MNEATTESHHALHYDVREASKVFSNTAAVLAGFAFAAVILVVQAPKTNIAANLSILSDWAVIAFLISLFGCIAASFVFGVVAGDKILGPRSFTVATLGGFGLSISFGLIFWGLTALIKVFLSPSVAELSRWIFFAVSIATAFFLTLSAIDPIRGFDRTPISLKLFLRFAVPSYLLILPAIFASCLGIPLLADLAASSFNIAMIVLLFIILLSDMIALFVSDKADDYRLSWTMSTAWLFLHSIVFAFLILLV